MVKIGIYLKAFFISLGIFLLGIIIGFHLERTLMNEITLRTKLIENSVREIELEMLYFQRFEKNSLACNFLNELIRKINVNLDELAGKLSAYSEQSIFFSKAELEELKKRYTYLLIKDWLLQERVKENCGTNVSTILYFYKKRGCEECVIQGKILSVLKLKYKERLMIFPIDSDVDVEMVKILMKNYNITKFPSLVISEKTYSGIIPKEEVEKWICSQIEC